ncbi:MAG: bifunctional 2-polyprenyl-6-hydroxyphenol methylase/3-demethylubiquinol 3-O-methyltransferase UbiG [Pseudomonadota bacterium]
MAAAAPQAGPTGRVDAAEIAKFEAMADEWWDSNGKFRPLHQLNPCRLGYIGAQIAAEFARDLNAPRPFEGLRLLDIGCGGGLLCEPMARLGAEVVGIDPAERNLPVARLHAERSGLRIDYRATTAEALVEAGETFDVVLCMEVVEHVPDPAAFIAAGAALLRPGGAMVASTLNRTPKAWALAVVAAERVLRWLPPGTHDYEKFVTPDELKAHAEAAGLEMVDRKGFVFDPLRWEWRVHPTDLSVNYVSTSVKPD